MERKTDMIYHITTPIEWKLAQQSGEYTAPSLEIEGFIHCSTAIQVVPVANAFYSNVDKLLLLYIDESKLTAELKWEAPAHIEGHDAPENSEQQLFPHIFGVINLDAVIEAVPLPKNAEGYSLPEGI